MKYYLLSILLMYGAQALNAQDIPIYKAEKLMKRVEEGKDTMYILNFWATWCAPCIKELPEFEKLEEQNTQKPVKIILVSLDFREDVPEKLQRFLQRKKISSDVVWLDETNAEYFIPLIEPLWTGSIPATVLIYQKKEYRNFFEGTITASQLQLLMDKQLRKE
jgi:thiol-disulfide isomerase/thioredoxin